MWAAAITPYFVQQAEPGQWEEAFKSAPLHNPEPSQRSSSGFVVNPEGVFCDSVGDRHAFVVGIARRHLPKDAVDREEAIRVAAAAAAEKEKPSRDAIEREMLATAPIREERVPGIYDAATGTLLLWCAARTAEDFVLPALAQALPGFQALPWLPAVPVQGLATAWLKTGELPLPFTLGEDAELTADDGDGKVRVSRQDLRQPTVLALLEEGRQVRTVEVMWLDKLSFRINGKAELRRIGPPGCKLKPRQAFETWPDLAPDLFGWFEAVIRLTGGKQDEAPEQGKQEPGTPGPGAPVDGEAAAAATHAQPEAADQRAGQGAEAGPKTSEPEDHAAQGAPASLQEGATASAPTPPPALVVVGRQVPAGEVVEFLAHHQARRPWGEILVLTDDAAVYAEVACWANHSTTTATRCEGAPDLQKVRGVVVLSTDAANEPLLQAAREAGVPLVVPRR